MSSTEFAPSILSADFSDMKQALRTVESSGARWLHLDVMDGHFVPNLTFGPKMIADLRKQTGLFLDTHLMVSNPEQLLDDYMEAGSDAVTFHIEACVHAHRLVQRIKSGGKLAGISLVPSTPVGMVGELLADVDLVLVMTVNPGFGGQSLIPSCLEKIRTLANIRKQQGLRFKISVDGGVNTATAATVLAAGADILVMGSAFFGSADPGRLLTSLSR